MAAFIGERVGIRDITRDASIPQNPKAKLMYYLNCVATVIQLDDPALSRLKNYQSYYSLSEEETDALLAFVILLSPDELIGKVFFPSEDCGRYTNKFLELSAVSHMLAVANNIVIGGERKRVGKIMFFQRSWMETYYLTPIRSFQDRLQRMARGLPGRAPTPRRALPPSRPRATSSSSSCSIL
ncbi:unnamed protein product [Porites lobata]|uniref:Uncharacterized protein n=1 Tax=Porites lobata TaxID=104759 RepID=A0ABN8NEC6_9CNID|nr:unnamed protein product [Porites lobata]